MLVLSGWVRPVTSYFYFLEATPAALLLMRKSVTSKRAVVNWYRGNCDNPRVVFYFNVQWQENNQHEKSRDA